MWFRGPGRRRVSTALSKPRDQDRVTRVLPPAGPEPAPRGGALPASRKSQHPEYVAGLPCTFL